MQAGELLAQARGVRLALDGLDDGAAARVNLGSKFALAGATASGDVSPQRGGEAAWLVVQKAPAGERYGQEELGGVPAVPLLLSTDSRTSCFTFGRDPRSSVRLKWDGVSRAHAWIDLPKSGSIHELVCNGSGNGTFVNGRRISRCWLRDGDVIGFGHGHDVREGDRLDKAAIVYEFIFTFAPLPAARAPASIAPRGGVGAPNDRIPLREMQSDNQTRSSSSPPPRASKGLTPPPSLGWRDMPSGSPSQKQEGSPTPALPSLSEVANRAVARAVEAKAEAGPGTGEASALREALETLSWTRTRLREEEKVVEQLRARQEKEDEQLVVREAERARLDEETRRLSTQVLELQAALDAQQKAAAAGERRWEERYAADVEAVRVEMEQARRSVQAEKKEAQELAQRASDGATERELQLQGQVQGLQDMLRAQKDKFTEVMAKTKTQMQDAVLRNDGAVAEAQAQSLALRSERDTLSVELQAVRETLEAVQEQVAKSREEVKRSDEQKAQALRQVAQLQDGMRSLAPEAVEQQLAQLRAQVTEAEEAVTAARDAAGEQMQRERVKAGKEREKLAADAKAQLRIAQAATSARDAAVKEKDDLARELECARREAKQALDRRGDKEAGRVRSLTDDVARLKGEKLALEEKLKAGSETERKDKEAIAKLRARCDALASAQALPANNAEASVGGSSSSAPNTPGLSSSFGFKKGKGATASGWGAGGEAEIKRLKAQMMERDKEIERLKGLQTARERGGLESEGSPSRLGDGSGLYYRAREKELKQRVEQLEEQLNAAVEEAAAASHRLEKAEAAKQRAEAGLRDNNVVVQRLRESEIKAREFERRTVSLSEELETWRRECSVLRSRVAELEDILQHREREAEALRIASPLPATLDRPRNAVHTSPIKMDGGRGSSSPQASPIRATREHVSPPAPAPPPPPPSEALSAVLQIGISPPHYPPLAGNGERSETGVMMEVMDKEGAAEMQAELQARLASVEPHGDEGDLGKDTEGPVVLEGHHHTDIVNAVAAMGAGVVVSVSADASAVFWGVASGEKLLSVPLAGKGVAVCVAPQDGLPGASSYKMVAASNKRSLHTWICHFSPTDVAASSFSPTTPSLETLPTVIVGEGGSEVKALALSGDGKFLAAGSTEKEVDVFVQDTGGSEPWRSFKRLPGHSGSVVAVAFGVDGMLASGSYDRTIRLWTIREGFHDIGGAPLRGHAHWVMALAFTRDCSLLASASYDRSVRVWDVAARRALQVFNGHTDRVTCVCFLSLAGNRGEGGSGASDQRENGEGLVLASGSYDKQIKLWDVDTGKALENELRRHSGEIKSIAAVNGGAADSLVSTGSDKTVLIWKGLAKKS